MQYFLTPDEMTRFTSALKTTIAIPFIDDIEDYIVEAIWEHAKSIDGIDPFYNIRSKKLYDVVDENTHIGWSVKSIQWAFYNECEFELFMIMLICLQCNVPNIKASHNIKAFFC